MGYNTIALRRKGSRQREFTRFTGRIHARELGRRLRVEQLVSGVDGVALSRALGMNESRVSRIMCGVILPPAVEVAAILAVFGVTGARRDEILDLSHPRHDMGVLRLSGGRHREAFLYHAAEASHVIDYQPLIIPTIAQIGPYRNAWASLPVPAQWDAQPDHEATVALLRDAVWTELLVHEWALQAPVATHAVRSRQMRWLWELSTWRKLSVRVIPAYWALPLPALSGFTVLEFPSRPSLVYREEPGGGVFFDEPEQVDGHLEVTQQLREIALNTRQSRELIEQVMNEPTLPADPRPFPAGSLQSVDTPPSGCPPQNELNRAHRTTPETRVDQWSSYDNQ